MVFFAQFTAIENFTPRVLSLFVITSWTCSLCLSAVSLGIFYRRHIPAQNRTINKPLRAIINRTAYTYNPYIYRWKICLSLMVLRCFVTHQLTSPVPNALRNQSKAKPDFVKISLWFVRTADIIFKEYQIKTFKRVHKIFVRKAPGKVMRIEGCHEFSVSWMTLLILYLLNIAQYQPALSWVLPQDEDKKGKSLLSPKNLYFLINNFFFSIYANHAGRLW